MLFIVLSFLNTNPTTISYVGVCASYALCALSLTFDRKKWNESSVFAIVHLMHYVLYLWLLIGRSGMNLQCLPFVCVGVWAHQRRLAGISWNFMLHLELFNCRFKKNSDSEEYQICRISISRYQVPVEQAMCIHVHSTLIHIIGQNCRVPCGFCRFTVECVWNSGTIPCTVDTCVN